EAKSFRQGFFSKLDVWCVANFGNLAYVLFAGRTNLPAACLFYRPKQSDDGHGSIATFAPFVTEQDSNRPSKAGGQVDTWNILVRATDWREIDRDEAAKGERLTWKLAMWGSERDQRLLRRIARFPRFEAWSKQGGIIAAQGPEIREQNSQGTYPHNSELIGKRKVSFTGLRGTRRLFTLPASCLLPPLKASECYVRRAGGLEVGEPPHLLFDEARRFAIFHNEYAIIPPRQIGIHGKNTKLLKALSLYLCSLPARWHQFFVSSHWGVSLSIATLADLRTLPIPLSPFEDNTIAELAELYDALAKDEQNAFSEQDRLLAKAENVIAKLLGLRSHERDLIEGFFAGPYECVHGKFPSQALDVASVSDIRRYCKVLRRELDDYLEERGVHHDILALIDSKQVCLAIEGKRTKEPLDPKIEELNGKKPDFFQRISTELRQKHSQRVYFEKTLFFYQRGQMLFLKPRRALEWNARRALLDADDLIGELLAGT
ncbi:MAG TPA: hypothetical protein VKV04_18790, partial [Verrucomicrobiae bacterium]|nr:hypothetical protein [Verrucomicrobiae bacterium]